MGLLTTNISDSNISLDMGQNKRLEDYKRNLAIPRDPEWFDDRVRDVLIAYEKSSARGIVHEVNLKVDQKVNEEGRHFSRSFYDPRQIEKALNRFVATHSPSKRWNPHYQDALNELREQASHHHAKMLTFTSDVDIKENLPRRDTHSGFTFIESGMKEKGENLEGLKDEVVALEEAAKMSGTLNRPMMIGSRTQGNAGISDEGEIESDFKQKTRLVLMVDLKTIVIELKWSIAVQRIMADWREYAGGKNRNQQAIIIHGMRSKYKRAISLDYSAYDQSLPGWLIEDVFSIIREFFRNDANFDESLWNVMVHDFIHKDIIWTDGIVHCDDGVPSGSMWTQIIDSIANKLMIETAFKVIDGGEHQCFIMGDDNLVYFICCDVKRLQEVIQYMFGVTVNQSKTKIFGPGEDPEFLSCYWRMDGTQWRQPKILIDHLLWPERHRNYVGTIMTPELVIYSYILAYYAGMAEWFDVERFMRDFHFAESEIINAPAGTLSGYWEFERRYGYGMLAA